FPMRSSVTLSPSALLNRTVMNQSSTNVFGFEKKIAVFFTATVAPGSSSAFTSYVSGRMSGFTTTVAEGAGVGVGRYSGASTLHAESNSASRAHVSTRRITPSLVRRSKASGGYGVANFAVNTAFTAMAESTEPNTPGLSVYSSSTAAIAIEGCSNEAHPMNHASTFPAAGDSAVPLFPAVEGE